MPDDAHTAADPAASSGNDDAERIDALLAEVQVRLDEQRARGDALSSRAAILVASTAITISLLDLGADKRWVIAATICTILAAAFGVYALFPKQGQYANLMDLREAFYDTPLQDARARLVDTKIQFYADSKKRLSRHGVSLRLGFAALAVGITLAALGTIVGGENPVDEPSPSAARETVGSVPDGA